MMFGADRSDSVFQHHHSEGQPPNLATLAKAGPLRHLGAQRSTPLERALWRQYQSHDGAAMQGAVDLKSAAMAFDQGFDQRQAQTGAFGVAGERRGNLAEGFQRQRNLFRRHADVGIAYRQHEAALIGLVGADSDLASRRRELDGVGAKIEKGLLEAQPVHHKVGQARRHLQGEAQAPLMRLAARQSYAFADDVGRRNLLIVELELSRRGLGKIQKCR